MKLPHNGGRRKLEDREVRVYKRGKEKNREAEERSSRKARWRKHTREQDGSVTNFIRPYLHQFSIYSHGLNGYGKPLKRPFDRYQSRLEAINNGRDIRQINWYRLLNHQYLGNRHDLSFAFRHQRSPLHTAQNEPKTAPRRSVSMEIWRPQCLHMDFINYP